MNIRLMTMGLPEGKFYKCLMDNMLRLFKGEKTEIFTIFFGADCLEKIKSAFQIER